MEVAVKRSSITESQLPSGWVRKRCSEMGDIIAGKALNSKGAGTLRPYLRTINVLDGAIDLEDVLQMPFTDSEFEKYRLRYGDVLLNEGQTLELVGRCSMYRGEYPGECAIQNQLLRFRSHDNVCAEYAEHLFRYCQHTDVFEGIATQTTSVAHLGLNRFRDLLLPWPSDYSEQKAIADALSDVDALIERLDALIAKKRAIKTATMQRLLTGQQRLPGFSAPWTTKRLGEIARLQIGRTPDRNNDSFWGRGHPWAAISDLDTRILNNTSEQITRSAAVGMSMVPKGTLMMSFKLSIGRLAFAGRDMYTNEAICSFLNPRVSTDYLYYALQQVDFTEYGKRAVKGVTLNKQSLHAVEVPCPPKKEQKAIATILSDMDAGIEALQARRDKTQAIKQGMMQELLTGRTRLV
jgi:type I restriction enzyme S subunit